MAAAQLHAPVAVIFVAGVAVDDLRAVHSVLKHGGVAVPVGVGVDDEDLIVEFLVEFPGTGAAHIGVGAKPVLVDAVHQIVIVILGEAQLGAQNHIEAQLVAPLFGGLVAGEIVVHGLLPVMLRVDAGEVLRMQMVCDHQTGKAVLHIALHNVGGRQMAAFAGFRGMGMRIVKITLHGCMFLSTRDGRPSRIYSEITWRDPASGRCPAGSASAAGSGGHSPECRFQFCPGAYPPPAPPCPAWAGQRWSGRCGRGPWR